jgi:hypothetical protein
MEILFLLNFIARNFIAFPRSIPVSLRLLTRLKMLAVVNLCFYATKIR